MKENNESKEILYLFMRNYKIVLVVFIIVMALGVGFIKYEDVQNAKKSNFKETTDHYLFSIQSKNLTNPMSDTKALLSNRAITQNLNLLKQNIKSTNLDPKAIESIQNMDVTIPPSPQSPDIFWINIQAPDKPTAQKYADMIVWYVQNSPQANSVKNYLKEIYDDYYKNNSKASNFGFLQSQIQEILKNGVIISSELSKKYNSDIEDMVVWTNVSSQLTQGKMWVFLVVSALMISIFSAFVADFFRNFRSRN
ncbi:hypothetical protein [Helicobacter cappadocius]|uniref:Uncharacterized protein n=1 Tax=Helicobacter cappadocius TaxID=3063998 RepID=A0AA90PK56_9HELI|nr:MULTISPECIES: hypothetical protein [unclassified Helicobacter]MDO7253001.1 hypothetical protein [Helicobacter sp. faydin-H75]MDP2539010.1 hypothetical protein [Helicobacter sp. faydin-H76]